LQSSPGRLAPRPTIELPADRVAIDRGYPEPEHADAGLSGVTVTPWIAAVLAAFVHAGGRPSRFALNQSDQNHRTPDAIALRGSLCHNPVAFATGLPDSRIYQCVDSSIGDK
jgi:hypothetical protein